MQRITVTIDIDCQDDIPDHVVEWMADNLADHAVQEFGNDYDPEWTDGYEGPPLAGPVTWAVEATTVPPWEGSLKRPSRGLVCAAPGCVCLTDLTHAYCAVHRRRQTRAMREVTRRLRASQEPGAGPIKITPAAADTTKGVL